MKNLGPRVFAVVPARNEADRYLGSCLSHLENLVDGIVVVDDNSSDDTVMTARAWLGGHPCAAVFPKHPSVPSMQEHEGRFRQYVLNRAVEFFEPREGRDWILVNDADEFLVAPVPQDPRTVLYGLLEGLGGRSDVNSLVFGRDELWSLDPPRNRVDGQWGAQMCQRIFRFRKQSLSIPMFSWATGSIPSECRNSSTTVANTLRIVHVGYAKEEDRRVRYERHRVRPGHGRSHVESIMDENPVLQTYSLDIEEVVRP